MASNNSNPRPASAGPRSAGGPFASRPPELHLIYDTAPIGLAFLSPDCHYLQINQRLTEICGMSVEDHLGRTVRETVPGLADAVEDIMRTIMRTGEPVTGVEVAGQQQGQSSERSWITYWHPLKDANGTILGVNVAAEEITERKRAEAALLASERRFHTLADTIPQLVWMARHDGQIFWFNSRWRNYTGLVDDTVRGRAWTTVLDPADTQARSRWNECLLNGTPFEAEVELRDRSGQFNPFLTRAVPLHDLSGTVTRWIGTHIDISEQKNREQHVRVIVDELSHRTKNLLTMVMAVARQTAQHATDLEQFQDRFLERLRALSDCHDLLAKDQRRGAAFKDLLAAQLRPFREAAKSQIETTGPSLLLKPEAVHYLGLAFHELATNASKHGALSVPQGHVSIRWLLDEETDSIQVRWHESGGPPVTPPERKGFGHVVIERIVPQALNGTSVLDFTPTGVNWALRFPTSVTGVS